MPEGEERPAAEERWTAATVHGRYLVRRPARGAPRAVLVGFHGYGENAERHLQALAGIPGAEGFLLVAVQGLHAFYNSRTGEVVASWMTRQGRLQAIRDNLAYVGRVVGEARAEAPTAPLFYAGFSQGVAMAYRAAAGAGHASRGLVVLAGDVPPEVAEIPGVRLPPVLIGRGLEDEWYDAGKQQRDRDTLAGLGVEVELSVFAGGHEWSAEFYAAAGEFLARRAGAG